MSVSDRNTDWRKKLREEIKGKARTEIERVKMPERAASERVKSQRLEVNTGLTEEMGPPGKLPVVWIVSIRLVWKVAPSELIFRDLSKI